MSEIKKKIAFLPYDNDTAIGINNEGALTLTYNLEDTDHLESGADVFNGQESVLWNNLRDAFPEELRAMFQELRSQGKLSYEVVEKMYEDHQEKWSEAIFNEDAFAKYLAPLLQDNDASYLSMLLGSKKAQRQWWLYNRFRYLDSKYNAGDALTDVITLRGYAKANVTITPYADVYPTVKFGSYLVQKRGKRNEASLLECPLDSVNDTEIYIYSASQLKDVGDLSGLMVGYANFSMATKLQALKLGDSAETYSNGNLKELYLGNNTLLRVLDVRNCPNLGLGDVQQAVDISGCTNIEEVYFDGTAITALTVPNGGVLKKLHLPGTITNLTIRNQTKIEEFLCPNYTGITTLRLENVSDEVPMMEILSAVPDNSRVRLIGVNWDAGTYEVAKALYDVLDKMRGLDENGNNLDGAVVSGTISIDSLTGAQLKELHERQPNIEVDYKHITSYLRYHNWDGTVDHYTESIPDGGDGTYNGKPSRASTAQYSFTFVGWSTKKNQTVAEANATKNVTEDRDVYAVYTPVTRTYTATFARASEDGGGTLYTQSNVPYGTTPTYGGTTPTTTKGSATDYPFKGWTPELKGITGNTTYYAVFQSAEPEHTITDDWDTIIAKINAAASGADLEYQIGDTMSLDMGSEGFITMALIAKDADDLADGSGKAKTTWLSVELLKTSKRWNPASQKDPDDNPKYVEGTGTVGGWEKSELRAYYRETLKSLVPETVRNAIKPVSKVTRIFDTSGNAIQNSVTEEDVWAPSYREVFSNTNLETQGATYGTAFPDNNSRIKKVVGASSADYWWLRSANGVNYARRVRNSGDYGSYNVYYAYPLALGFSI